MSQAIFSILAVYIFILMGFIAKWHFRDEIHDKTITLLNVYFLQVFLTFWGLLIRPVDTSLLYAPTVYLIITLFVLLLSALAARYIFFEQKEYSIATTAAIIGNTGNLGIPLNIAIFGQESIPYTTIINLVNVFIVYTVGVFYYSRGSFSVKSSLLNIVKLPILWAACVALLLSFGGYKPNGTVLTTLMMGAYASMTMQLFLFGIYLYGTTLKTISLKLTIWVMSVKFLVLPLIAFFVLRLLPLDGDIKGIIFMEILMPLAVANVNLASLYDCAPRSVTAQVFLSSVLFLGIVFIGVSVLPHL